MRSLPHSAGCCSVGSMQTVLKRSYAALLLASMMAVLDHAARAPLAALPHDAADRRNSRGSAAAGACAAAADTPCISMLSQKAEGLSLRSAQPPARDNLARGARYEHLHQ